MSDPAKQISYLAAALKAPRIRDAATRLAAQAKDSGWTHEDYLIAVLDREVAARNASGAQLRIRAAGFPARKTFEEFNFDHQPGIRRDDIAPLAAGHYLTEARNVVLLGPPGTGKTHVAIALGIAACHSGHRVLFATATDWVARLQDAYQRGRLAAELTKLRRYGLIICPLGRRLRRPNRRRGHDRPHRPPRRRPHPQRRQLPAETPRRRYPPQRPTQRSDKLDQPRGPVFEEHHRPTIQRASTVGSRADDDVAVIAVPALD
jgi:hypothetical protein